MGLVGRMGAHTGSHCLVATTHSRGRRRGRDRMMDGHLGPKVSQGRLGV